MTRRRDGAAILAAVFAFVGSASGALTPIGAGLKGPGGVRADLYASGLTRPTAFAFDGRGGLWATSADGSSRPTGKVVVVSRRGAAPRVVVAGLRTPLGLVWHRGELYVSSTGRVDAYAGFTGRAFRRRRTVIAGLPTGLHQNNGIVPGRDGRLYMGLGSPCDACKPTDPRQATILSFTTTGRDVRVVATGLRNAYGLAVLPGGGELIATDNGRDDLGLALPPEELNLIRPGMNYGAPACWGQGGPPCAGTEPALARLRAHASSSGVSVVAGPWGPVAGTTAFVTEYGSSFRPPTGRDVIRVDLRRVGNRWRARSTRFLTGFANPLAIVTSPTRELIVGDFTTGRVYRVRPSR
ncbi:MAG: PQQ-dependent sugar dehydrogenase [Actinobacteria bacterium]|nr:PQQ-dependent sugar dehydrogenase [Actinomycetota bacterium]